MTPPRTSTPPTAPEGVLQKSGPPPTLVYPLAPLMEAAGLRTMAELRARCPMNGQQYRRVIDHGLSEVQADRWAVKLGLLPAEVWPGWVDDAKVECAAEDCQVRFFPVQAHQRFHHATCSSRQRRRDRYRTDPAYRDERRRQARRYYEECGDYVRERNRANKQTKRAAEQERAVA